MTEINKIFCGADVKNTGVCDCFFDPKLITGGILVPLGRVYSEEELDDLVIQATLENDTMATKKNRIFPLPSFVAITDNSEEPTQQTFGYGSIATVREGNYNWRFQFRKGGLNLSNSLRTFNGLTGKYGVIFFENQNTKIGTSKKDSNGNWGIGGIPLEDLYTLPWKPNDGTNLSQYAIRFVFRPEYINELIAFKKVATTSYLLSELKGLEDIVLEILDTDDSGSGQGVTIGASTDCGSTNLFELFADELENEEAWIVRREDGTIVDINSATKNEDAEGWDLDYDVEDGDTITLAAPIVLAAAPINMIGYEGNTVTVDLGS